MQACMRFKGHNIAKVHGIKLTPNLEDLELKFKETPTPGLELTLHLHSKFHFLIEYGDPGLGQVSSRHSRV